MMCLFRKIKNSFEDSLEKYFTLIDMQGEEELNELIDMHVFEKSMFNTVE